MAYKKTIFAMLFTSIAWTAHAAPADDKINAAAAAFQQQDYTRAASLFKQAVASDKNNAMAWHFYGQSLAKIGDNMGARRAYAQVLKIAPDKEVATRTLDLLAKMPPPDLFTMQLDSGLTLGDWLPVAESRAAQGKRDAVLKETTDYLQQFGPVPQLLALQGKLNKDKQAEEEQRLQSAISGIKLTDAESAQAALPQIRELRQQAPGSLKLIAMEAKACHLMQDFGCAEKAYGQWLKTAPGNDPKRRGIAAGLISAKSQEPLPPQVETGIEMVEIPSKNYEIGKFEVTQKQWQEIMGTNPSNFPACGEDCPVEGVSWNDIQEFVQKLNAKTGMQYRLPTESEWQYACLGGKELAAPPQKPSGTATGAPIALFAAAPATQEASSGSATEYCGSNDVNSVAWTSENSGNTTHPVGQKQPNGYGLYDMSGNVWEWVQDKWSNEHDSRVVRGGSWLNNSRDVRVMEARYYSDPGNRVFRNFGFRLARTLP